jgi:hypothetical protein
MAKDLKKEKECLKRIASNNESGESMNPRCSRCYNQPHYSVILAPAVAACNRCGRRFPITTTYQKGVYHAKEFGICAP